MILLLHRSFLSFSIVAALLHPSQSAPFLAARHRRRIHHHHHHHNNLLQRPSASIGSSWRGGSKDHHELDTPHSVATTTSATKGIIEAAAVSLLETTTTTTTTANGECIAATSTTESSTAGEDESVMSTEKEDDDGDSVSSTESIVIEEVDSQSAAAAAQEQADRKSQSNQLRSTGKSQHDAKDFTTAATSFHTAASLLDPNTDPDYATLKLHEALCWLKADENTAAAQACTHVLDRPDIPADVRARALFRRAKASIGDEDREGALADARAAAFLGDHKAVALYGQLMRDTTTTENGDDASGYDQSVIPDMMGRSSSSAALLESMLQKATAGGTGGDPAAVFNPASLFSSSPLLQNMFSSGASSKNKSKNSLAQSVLQSLSKRLTDESTHTMICGFLKNIQSSQLESWSTMAGFPLTSDSATKLATVCQTVTPKGIRRLVTWGQRVTYMVQLGRKTSAVLSKYRGIIVLWLLAWWIQSALLRPLPAKTLRKMLTESVVTA